MSFYEAVLSLEVKRVGLEGKGSSLGEWHCWGHRLMDGVSSDTI